MPKRADPKAKRAPGDSKPRAARGERRWMSRLIGFAVLGVRAHVFLT